MNVSNILFYGNKRVLSTIERFPESGWLSDGVLGVWSVKDIIAHLASFELIINDVLTVFIDPKAPTPYLDKKNKLDETFNDVEVEVRQHMTAKEIIEEYVQAAERSMELAKKITPEKFREVGTIPWYGDIYSLEDLIVYMSYGHKCEHCAQIDIFRRN